MSFQVNGTSRGALLQVKPISFIGYWVMAFSKRVERSFYKDRYHCCHVIMYICSGSRDFETYIHIYMYIYNIFSTDTLYNLSTDFRLFTI